MRFLWKRISTTHLQKLLLTHPEEKTKQNVASGQLFGFGTEPQPIPFHCWVCHYRVDAQITPLKLIRQSTLCWCPWCILE